MSPSAWYSASRHLRKNSQPGYGTQTRRKSLYRFSLSTFSDDVILAKHNVVNFVLLGGFDHIVDLGSLLASCATIGQGLEMKHTAENTLGIFIPTARSPHPVLFLSNEAALHRIFVGVHLESPCTGFLSNEWTLRPPTGHRECSARRTRGDWKLRVLTASRT